MVEEISLDAVLYPRRTCFRKEENFYIILNSDTPNLMVTDELGKSIFELCNGKNTVSEILERLHSDSPLSEVPQKQIMMFISSHVKAGFLSLSPFSPIEMEIKRNLTLNQAYLHLTHGCNLRCKHCHISAGIPYKEEMSEKRVLTLIEELTEIGLKELIITGGEPFLRRKLLYSVVEKARNLGVDQVSVETNGTLVTEEDATFLKHMRMKAAVSLDGAHARTNDFIRGKGVFNRALKGINLLVKAGVYTNIGMTLMHHNLNEAIPIVKLAKELGVNQVTLNTVFMKGRAKENQTLDISLKHIIPVVKKAWKIAKKSGLKTNVDEFLAPLREGVIKYSCGAGVNVLSIDANGDVYPCNFFLGGPLKAGNVYKSRLNEVLEKSPLIQEFRKLTVFDTDCRDCELSLICAGCPAESFEFCGDFKKRTPWCSLRKEIIWDVVTELAHELWQRT